MIKILQRNLGKENEPFGFRPFPPELSFTISGEKSLCVT